jgi:transcriptional regulator with XRE-family HTH domain
VLHEKTRRDPLGAQVRAARAMLKLTQEQSAQGSGIALSALKKYETLENDEFPLAHLRYQTISKLIKFYEAHGVAFFSDDESMAVQRITRL